MDCSAIFLPEERQVYDRRRGEHEDARGGTNNRDTATTTAGATFMVVTGRQDFSSWTRRIRGFDDRYATLIESIWCLRLCNEGIRNARAFSYPLDVGSRLMAPVGLDVAGGIATMIYFLFTLCMIGQYSPRFLQHDPIVAIFEESTMQTGYILVNLYQ